MTLDNPISLRHDESTPPAPRSAAIVQGATRAFARERPATSRRAACVGFGLLGVSIATAAFAPWWPLRIAASAATALALVRCFALYHDFLHGAILARSATARAAFYAYGALVLTPPRSWRASHNAHHADVGKLARSHVGSFPLMTVAAWRRTSLRERIAYRATRHPLAILFAYVTVFIFNICLVPLLRHPRVHWDSALTLLGHGAVVAVLWSLGGPAAATFGLLIPAFVASAFGACLFYVQHNFPGLYVAPDGTWTRGHAALEASSCLRMSPMLHWVTGNLGFHHVHHLNPRIPFYRLREAMERIPELQRPADINLSVRDVASCFGANLWDESGRRIVSFREAASLSDASGALVHEAERGDPGRLVDVPLDRRPRRVAAAGAPADGGAR